MLKTRIKKEINFIYKNITKILKEIVVTIKEGRSHVQKRGGTIGTSKTPLPFQWVGSGVLFMWFH